MVDLIGGDGGGRSLEDVAADAGTIAYEILTALGRRYERRYLGGIG
jgi:alanine racemase